MTRTVIHYSDSTVFGGTERAILHLAKGMDRAEWRVVLMHDRAAPSELVDRARAIGAETHVAPRVGGKLDVAHLAELTAAVRRHHADVFHAHLHWPLAAKYGIAAAAAARVPVVVATAQLHVELDHAGFVDLQHRAMTSMIDRYIAVSRDVGAQLQRRFGVRIELEAFRYNTSKERQDFRRFLNVIDEKLPLAEKSDLADSNMALCIFEATNGVVAHVMKLVRQATGIAVESCREKLTIEILALAYEQRLAANNPGKPNPFGTVALFA